MVDMDITQQQGSVIDTKKVAISKAEPMARKVALVGGIGLIGVSVGLAMID